LSQIQDLAYADMFGFGERFIVAKIFEISRNHWLGDQIALEALVRFCEEELKHQELFRRIEAMMALILETELFTQAHYKQSIEPEANFFDLYKDIFLYDWKEEVYHAYGMNWNGPGRAESSRLWTGNELSAK
jgi:hypothetical protein